MNPDEERDGPVLYEEDKDLNNEIIEIPKTKKTLENNSNFFSKSAGQDTGKNKDKSKLDVNPFYAPVNHNEFDHDLPEDRDKKPDILALPPKVTPTPNQNSFLLGFNFPELLQDNHTKLSTKLLIIYFLCTTIFSIILSGLEVGILFESSCPENKRKESLKQTVLIGYVVVILLKVLNMAYLNLELFNKTPYINPYTFLVPLLWLGIIPCLELPQIVYDYEICSQRNPLIKLNEVEEAQIAIIAVVAFTLFLKLISYTLRTHNILKGKIYNVTRITLLILAIFIILPLNILTILLTFTQLPEFLPFFFFENQFFYILCLIMMVWNYAKYVKQWEYIFAAQKEAQFMGIVEHQGTN